ncbi:MAG: hypothetical protein CJBNEKGG_03582 [Prosthecobacter sp.]|nr:hypothetical protein [Prosthecobacter sp.]
MTNPVNLFGSVPEDKRTYGHILAEDLGTFSFKLYPQLWVDSQVETLRKIKWERVKFGSTSEGGDRDKIPSGPGVYIFVVEGRIDLFHHHSYLFYAGKAEKGLRSRYDDYLHEREGEEPEEDRPKITKFLNYFRSWVYFYFAEFSKGEVAAIESAIKDNFTPPANSILKLKGRLY